jgi:hypothetical protein
MWLCARRLHQGRFIWANAESRPHLTISSVQLDGEQRFLFDETVLADLEAIALEIAALKPKDAPPPKEQPKRARLPPHLPRVEVRHEPEQTRCRCRCQLQRIGDRRFAAFVTAQGCAGPAG